MPASAPPTSPGGSAGASGRWSPGRLRGPHRGAGLAAARLGRRALLLAGRVVPRVRHPRGRGPGRRDRDDAVIHVAVARSRNLVAPPGVRLHRNTGLLENVRWNLGPPRFATRTRSSTPRPTRRRTCAQSRSWLMPCGSRRTTALRLLAVAEARATAPAEVADRHPDRCRGRHLLGARARLPDPRGAPARAAARGATGESPARIDPGFPGRGVPQGRSGGRARRPAVPLVGREA